MNAEPRLSRVSPHAVTLDSEDVVSHLLAPTVTTTTRNGYEAWIPLATNLRAEMAVRKKLLGSAGTKKADCTGHHRQSWNKLPRAVRTLIQAMSIRTGFPRP